MNNECFCLASKLLQTLPRAFVGCLTVTPFVVTSLKQVEISLVAASSISNSASLNSLSQLVNEKIELYASKIMKMLPAAVYCLWKRFLNASGSV